MKIGFFLDYMFVNSQLRGVERSLVKLLTCIKHQYQDVEILLISFDVSKINLTTIELKQFSSIEIKRDFSDVSILKNYKLDFIVFYCNGMWIEKFISLKPTTKFISVFHDIIPILPIFSNYYNQDYYIPLYTDVIKYSDSIISDSQHTKNDIINFFTPSSIPIPPIEVVHLAPLLDKTDSQHNISYPFFLYNGGHDYRKGIVEMLDNFLQLKIMEQLNANLVITGDINGWCPSSEKELFLLNYGIKNSWIINLGYVDDITLSSLYQTALAMVYPSSYEGFGLPLVEAMNLSCPIITCNNSSISEVCKDSAYYINRDNPDEFQKAFIDLETNSNLRNTLISKGLIRIKDFSWQESTSKFINTLKNIR